MESTRVSSGVLKAAAARAKGTAATASLKRQRGALQDISNSHTRGANAPLPTTKKPVASGVVKPTSARGVKRNASSMSQPTTTTTTATATTANVRARSTHVSAVTKRRRENAAEEHGKKQSLLSFKPKSTANKPKTAIGKATMTQEAKAEIADAEMVCTETLKAETSQPEPTPVVSAPVVNEEVQIEAMAPVEIVAPPPATTEQTTGAVPPYEPRPYVFKFDHRDSGFDEETYRSQIQDIDAPFQKSATHCVNIVRDMDRFHRQHQDKYRPSPEYIGHVQLDINEKMRTILIDWLVEVGEEYELDSQTFHKTVNLVDRYLATVKINRKQFQLLGCACMMIAAKFEEVYGPNVDEFVYISDQTYTSQEMLEMEMKVLQALEYRVASTTCHGFLPRFTQAGCNSDKQKFLTQYLCDFAMLYYHMLEYRPSMIAAAAVYLSRLMTNEEQPWTPTLHHFTLYNAWELKECVLDLHDLHLAERKLVEEQSDKAKAVSEKYASEKFLGVSATPSVDIKVVEQSFLVYEQPQQMQRCKAKQEALSAQSNESSITNDSDE